MSRISLDDLFRRAVDVVERAQVTYLVYGGIATAAWGAVLTTDDVDLVIRASEDEAARLIQALRQDRFHVSSQAESLFFVDTWFIASLDGRDAEFALGRTEFDEMALSRAVRVRVYERAVPIATAEDLVLYKLVAHRKKDVIHIEDILARQGRKLDLPYLRDWAGRIASATGKFEVPAALESMLAEEGLGGSGGRP